MQRTCSPATCSPELWRPASARTGRRRGESRRNGCDCGSSPWRPASSAPAGGPCCGCPRTAPGPLRSSPPTPASEHCPNPPEHPPTTRDQDQGQPATRGANEHQARAGLAAPRRRPPCIRGRYESDSLRFNIRGDRDDGRHLAGPARTASGRPLQPRRPGEPRRVRHPQLRPRPCALTDSRGGHRRGPRPGVDFRRWKPTRHRSSTRELRWLSRGRAPSETSVAPMAVVVVSSRNSLGPSSPPSSSPPRVCGICARSSAQTAVLVQLPSRGKSPAPAFRAGPPRPRAVAADCRCCGAGYEEEASRAPTLVTQGTRTGDVSRARPMRSPVGQVGQGRV